ncbi:sigma-70 family RNA polymerase sigma factor [Tundrisphaera sp. TA3]|uniref:sigma-70 family RNA polymerase sigma factor n=1 Tax=Tundrisphaera sp. TA3 TaxID=3435775 RepID=UPI003EB80EAB
MSRNDRKGQESGVMDIYLGQIQGDSLLTAAEECELAERIAAGDDAARSRMIRANLRLVVKIARDYTGRGMSLDDLIGEGNLGLIRAAEEFNPRFGTRFSTYASYWIKQGIRHALTNTTATIRLPAHMVTLLSKWRKAERTLYREQGRMPGFDEVAAVLGLTEAQRDMVMRARRASLIRGEGPSDDENGWSADEACDDREAPEEALERADDRRQLRRRMERLDDRERAILTLRFGLGGDAPMTLKEVGRRLGVTREWVRKIEVRAVRKLEDDAPVVAPAARKPRRAAAMTAEAGRARPLAMQMA